MAPLGIPSLWVGADYSLCYLAVVVEGEEKDRQRGVVKSRAPPVVSSTAVA